MNQASVAVLLSTYNGEKYVEQQIKSVLSQTYQNIKIIYRDDGSTDKTRNVVDKVLKNKQYICMTDGKNIGPAKSFIYLLSANPEYDYYAFCDQDDIWEKDKIETAIEQLSKVHVPALYVCRARTIDGDGNVICEDSILSESRKNIPSELICGIAPGCAMVLNKELADIMITQKFSGIPMHDMLAIILAFAKGKFIYDSKICFSRRMHSNNVVGKKEKNWLQTNKQRYRRWVLDSQKAPLDIFMNELLDQNIELRNSKEYQYFYDLANYKKSLACKIRLLTNKEYDGGSSSARRSFVIRLLLNLL